MKNDYFSQEKIEFFNENHIYRHQKVVEILLQSYYSWAKQRAFISVITYVIRLIWRISQSFIPLRGQ